MLLVAVLDRLRDLPERRAALYCDLILSSLPDATRRVLEDLMLKNYEYQSDFARRYVAEGLHEGLVLSLRKVFAVRGIVLTEEQSARLEACTDRAVLEAWLERAVVARDAAEVFEPV